MLNEHEGHARVGRKRREEGLETRRGRQPMRQCPQWETGAPQTKLYHRPDRSAQQPRSFHPALRRVATACQIPPALAGRPVTKTRYIMITIISMIILHDVSAA